MYGEVKVGELAIVISTTHVANRGLIGRVVTVVAIAETAKERDDWYEPPRANYLDFKLALVSGLGPTSGVKDGHSIILVKHLMPLPPLDDDAIIEATEKPKETTKC